MVKLSIDGYSFHQQLGEGKMDIFHYFESTRYRYGIQAVGIWNGFLTSLEEGYLKKIRETLDENDMAVPNVAVDGASLWDDDEALREKYRENALAHIRAAARIGAKSVRIDWGIRTGGMTEEQMRFIAERYREYCGIARELGMLLGPENHFGASLNPELQLKMIEAVDHPAYRILLHLSRWPAGAEEGDRLLAPYAMHVHVDPSVAEKDTEIKIRRLTDAGYDGYWGIEYGYGDMELARVEWIAASLKCALGKINRGGNSHE